MIEQLKLHVSIVGWQTSARRYRSWCSKIWAVTLYGAGTLIASTALAAERPMIEQHPDASLTNSARPPSKCLPADGFLRARLTGSIQTELDWKSNDTECSGATRPNSGVRLRFSHAFGKDNQRLVLVFGIPRLREGVNASALPVNVTVIREGAGEFYGTRGDDKCTIDRLTQHALANPTAQQRSYRITASGFCTQPARAVVGPGSIFITRFDFIGRVDFSAEDAKPAEHVLTETVTSN